MTYSVCHAPTPITCYKEKNIGIEQFYLVLVDLPQTCKKHRMVHLK